MVEGAKRRGGGRFSSFLLLHCEGGEGKRERKGKKIFLLFFHFLGLRGKRGGEEERGGGERTLGLASVQGGRERERRFRLPPAQHELPKRRFVIKLRATFFCARPESGSVSSLYGVMLEEENQRGKKKRRGSFPLPSLTLLCSNVEGKEGEGGGEGRGLTTPTYSSDI